MKIPTTFKHKPEGVYLKKRNRDGAGFSFAGAVEFKYQYFIRTINSVPTIVDYRQWLF